MSDLGRTEEKRRFDSWRHRQVRRRDATEEKQVLTSEEKTLFQNEGTGQSKAWRPLVQ